MQQAADYAAGFTLFSFDYSVHMSVKGAGAEQSDDALFHFTVQRPNKAAILGIEGLEGYHAVSDGEQTYVYVPDLNSYTLEAAGPTLADFPGLLHLSTRIPMGGVCDILFLDNFFETLMTGVETLRYTGQEELDGQLCHVLHFVEPDFDWDLWIAASDSPVLVQIRPDASKQLAALNAQAPSHPITMEVLVRFTKWRTGNDVGPDAFAIAPPSDAQLVEQFSAPKADGAVEE